MPNIRPKGIELTPVTESICPICSHEASRSPGTRLVIDNCQHCGVYLGRYFQVLDSLGQPKKKYSRRKAEGARVCLGLLSALQLVLWLALLAGLAVCLIGFWGALRNFLTAPVGIKDSPESSWLLPDWIACSLLFVSWALLMWLDRVTEKLDALMPQLECPVCYFSSRDRPELSAHVEDEHKWSPEATARWVGRVQASIFGAG